MNFLKGLTKFEYYALLSFAVLYAFYLFRIIYLAVRVRSHFRNVFVKLIIRSVYFGLIIIALMAPSFGDVKKEIKAVGKDIFICVDLSNSMNASDVQPTRLEKLKSELKNIVSSFQSDRIGLVIFSTDAFMQCPLTYDQSALFLFIETLSTKLVPQGGTDFGPPLELALKRLNDQSNNSGSQQAKFVILISDGEDFGEDTPEAVEKIKDSGVKLYTLGIGTKMGGRIPIGNGYKTDEDGRTIITMLNSDDLIDIASTTGGNYYEVSEGRNDVRKLITDMSKIEGEVRETKNIDSSSNKYFYFLFAALCLVLIDGLFTLDVIKI
jgi:Ca-activated chloride channel family protein